ncbi:MAG: Regulatory protein RecX [candidate division WS6 bacterium GW2011_GWF2_39_15]|uniref:Regulatory protein RecX n=1 Tax=candidate division WS6 bacterium GW2011_GWF2_39_15 TaxID=1619100 RepID=A0A0G0MQT6_9BACT|nr:MAG: Regulatory protein RecX [candidate division WS6 bacterium GW2011_GWF2_39_15]
MKVAILAAGAQDTLGGETRVALELASSLSQITEVALVYTGEVNEIKKEGKLLKVSLEGGGYENDNLPVFTTTTLQFLFDFLDSYKPDIIHSHSIWLAPFVAQLWALSNNVPYLYTTHLLPSRLASFLEFGNKEIINRFVNEGISKPYMSGFLGNCTAIIALNSVAHKEIRDYGYKGDLHIVPNGRFLSKYNNLKVPSVKDKEKRLLFVGSICLRKNQEYLVKVMDYLPKNYRLILVGRFFFDDYEQSFRNLVKKYKNIEVTGGIDPDMIPSYIEKAHLVVSASKSEVQSLSIIEAMASGRPIVGLSNETIDELVDDSVGKKLEKETSTKRFADAVMNVMKLSEKEYIRLSDNARARVEEFDWSIISARTLKIYEKYVKKNQVTVKSSWDNINRMITSLPDFPGRPYVLDMVDRLREGSFETAKSVNIWRKVPKKTLMLAGLTIGVAVAVFGFLKLTKPLKRVKRVKPS